MTAQAVEDNKYLTEPMGKLFLSTAAPIVMIMAVNGLFNLVDAYFLGVYVGAAALTAVTMMFPVQMLIIALSNMISNGFASIVARRFGAHDLHGAAQSFAVANLLGVGLAAILMVFFIFGGAQLVAWVTEGNDELARMAWTYMSILMFTSPLMFILSVQFDALRSEGKMAAMAIMSTGVTLFNIGFNYVFIGILDWGVAGSAWGTVAAQLLALALLMGYRMRGNSKLGFNIPPRATFMDLAKENLALGAPLSLNYLSISLVAGAVVAMLKVVDANNYEEMVGAYGIITRLMTFSFMPLLGVSMAFQSIVGNNYGGQLPLRVNTSIRVALSVAFFYALVLEIIFITQASAIADVFVDDAAMIAQVARILPILVMFYFIGAPINVLSGYFQAIGDAKRAAILSLSRNYLFGLPLLLIMPRFMGEWGVWVASPVGDVLMFILTLAVLYSVQRNRGYRFGMFLPIAAR
ncbi:putative MATE family efflux protein [Maritalea mobilis]|uniref:Multidrug export protein MepA n=1 Tax=Maritalea mobilis TaxID=483324 RepID=A0A4R6VVD3_9HYPH|nr:MATE family efflux transporter [Maritalea mobilis]TDQ66560.1 putative MATE family efflux protein [Maritalea mobilis]